MSEICVQKLAGGSQSQSFSQNASWLDEKNEHKIPFLRGIFERKGVSVGSKVQSALHQIANNHFI
jgi:hypothetical protein